MLMVQKMRKKDKERLGKTSVFDTADIWSHQTCNLSIAAGFANCIIDNVIGVWKQKGCSV